jgi:WD40-like Beta Propeller Repeat
MSKLVTTSLLVLAVFVPLAEAASAETPDATFAASVTVGGEFADSGTAQSVSISDDGRFLAFVSDAGNLDPDAVAGIPQAYVKDLETGELQLASRASGEAGDPANEPPPGEQPPTGIERALISGDGRYVLFTSRATNLAGGELPLPEEEAEEFFSTHVYRRDLRTGETLLVDRETGLAGTTHLLEASAEAISADGRFVVFRAETADLDDPDAAHESTNSGTIYVRDLQTGTTTLVSRASGEEGELADERSAHGAVSADGSHVAFDTFATNPGLGTEANEGTQVYVRELASPFATAMISRSTPTEAAPAGEQGIGESFEPVFIGEPCRAGFTSEATNLGAAGGTIFQAYVRDECAATPTTAVVGLGPDGSSFAEAALLGASDDGRLVLVTGEDPLAPRHLFLRDLGAAQTVLLDRASGGGALADRPVEQGALSANGCRAAFTSPATNLTADPPPSGGPSELLQVYVRQLAPCRPAPEGPRTDPPAGDPPRPMPAPVPAGVSILRLRLPNLRLSFSAAGEAGVHLDRLLVGDGKQRWKRVRSFVVSTDTAGQVRAALPGLRPGRYRLSVRLRAPDSPTLKRIFTVPAR